MFNSHESRGRMGGLKVSKKLKWAGVRFGMCKRSNKRVCSNPSITIVLLTTRVVWCWEISNTMYFSFKVNVNASCCIFYLTGGWIFRPAIWFGHSQLWLKDVPGLTVILNYCSRFIGTRVRSSAPKCASTDAVCPFSIFHVMSQVWLRHLTGILTWRRRWRQVVMVVAIK